MTLLDELKNYLDITWEDEAVDIKLTGIIERAENILSEYAGKTLNFKNLSEKQLLFDCCRYIYNNSLEDFKINFSSELFMLRADYAVRDAEDEEISKI